MDIVIPLGASTAANHIELRYCLRSIEMYVPDLGNVFIIGERPSWLRRAFHIPEVDQTEKSAKERNIFRKLMKAAYSPLISDDFLYFNDDHFLLAPWVEKYYHKGSLADSVRFASSLHAMTLANTLAFLGGGWNFDMHCPITFNKKKFYSAVNSAPWYVPHGYGIKSVYCNLNEIEGEYYPDLKIHQANNYFKLCEQLNERRFFSTIDTAMNQDMITVLESRYPNKSVYEKD